MAKSLLELGVNTGQWDAGLKKAQSALDKFVEANGGLQNALQKDNGDMLKFVQMMGKIDSTADTAKGKMNDYRRVLERLTADYNALNAAQQKGALGSTYLKSIDQITAKYRAASAEVAKLNTTLAVSNGTGMGGALKGAFAMFGPAALAAGGVMAAVSGLRTAMNSLVQTNMQFEQSSANLAAVLGTTRDQTTALTAQAKLLGSTTQYTAIQITDLQTNLARLGFTQQEILASTKAIQDFATATGANLGEAANLAGAALRGFGMNASEMERVASVLAVSTTKSALSFEKLATAIPIVAPVAKQFGFTIEDTVTLLAKLSDAGMDASMSATATRNIFLKMANESGKLAQALGRPVHNVEEFGEALKELRERGMSLNDILSMVGVRSTAAFAVFADNADTLKDFKDSITDCSDALDDMVKEQMNTLSKSVNIMHSEWEGLMLSFSNSQGILRKTTDLLAKMLHEWKNWQNRKNGGDDAVASYQRQMTAEDKKALASRVESFRKGGQSDETILNNANEAVQGLESQKEAIQRAFNDYNDALKSYWETPNDEGAKLITTLYSRVTGIKNPTLRQANDWDSARQAMYKSLALKNEEIERQNYIAGLVTPEPDNDDPNADKKKDEAVKVLKARYEEEEKAQIAALDRMAMQEEEYEAKVYEIKRAALEKIAKLYDEDSAERARANAALSQLDISYQGTQMRLARQKEREEAKAAKQQYEPKGWYNEYGISVLGTELNGQMQSARAGSQEYLIAADKIVDLTAFQNLLKVATQNGIAIDPATIMSIMDQIEVGVGVDDEEIIKLKDEIQEQLSGISIDVDLNTGAVKTASTEVKGLKTDWTQAAQAVAQFGSALQSVEDPTAKLAGIIAEAIASVAAGAGGAIAKMGQEGEAWSWIAFAISATATMVSTIAAIKNATKFEHGGMVGGNSFSGDNIVARLNSGEGVLTSKGVENAANLAASFGRGGATPNSTPYATGETIVLGVNNYFGRTGQGEIVTTAMLRRAGINIG